MKRWMKEKKRTNERQKDKQIKENKHTNEKNKLNKMGK
jgi:hypothetical protein